MKIIFFGTPRFAQIVLEKLIDSPFRPSIVVTATDAKFGRGQKLTPSPVKQTALKNDIGVLQPKSLSSVASQLSDVDLAILVAYGRIIPKEILSIPKYGFVNVHPSLLPKYRGPSPVQSAILAGDEKTGVSIMILDEQVDHGSILAQKEIPIEKDDTLSQMAEKLALAGAKLLIETLPYYLDGAIVPQPQNHKEATFTKHISKQDGYVDLKNPPDKKTFDRMVRAFYPWPTVWTKLKTNDERLMTIKFLPEGKIQPEGKRSMSINEFRNGYPQVSEKIEGLFKDKAQS